ncbi:glycogen phosphorylase [Veronia nyctiphanis]|uniref:Alpha-1,4 glucan phosphorylase n=1 Tax=Veronia nyctiphanis TaxID=1278244 RepID=A0A4Q0YTT3_9GAMM|nr:glycogen/starch/alpha-glucan phosphorylase [Veronia nyctiphanis]RXJ74667.1 glycogen phosphorylase [Veronia nyctiphanis]
MYYHGSDFDKEQFKQELRQVLTSQLAVVEQKATSRDWYQALGKVLSQTTTSLLLQSESNNESSDTRKVNYFSLEFLIGRLTGNNLINLGIYDQVQEALKDIGLSLSDLLEEENDPALGNGGLGRLAACFMDSLASQAYPAVGYGLHYEYGLFRQSFHHGRQQEAPDTWKDTEGYPWERQRVELTQQVGFWGHVEEYKDTENELRKRWVPALEVEGVAWDMPVVGYQNETTLPLRLWECKTSNPFDLTRFNDGDFVGAQYPALEASNITKVLYPNDNHEQGKALRLMQQYFLCACSVGDLLRRHLALGRSLSSLPDFETVQLNDTHPVIAIPELMRILMDEHGLEWDSAWDICSRTFAYTNHTLLPEALETWSEGLMGNLLPRHMQIIFDINHELMVSVQKKWPGDISKMSKLSIIEEGDYRRIRMANLAVVASYAVNGVAAMHSELVKRDLFPEFDTLYPGKLTNVTNGVTPRRWIKFCNPALANLITEKLGDGWIRDLNEIEGLKAYADDKAFQDAFMAVKKANKQKLADWVKDKLDIELNTDAIFDVQIKRLHEYKRQHLNLLHILSLYHRLLNEPDFDIHPRVFIFAAKAAPGYALAKDIIYAINRVAETVNNDARLKDKLKVVFLPDYRVSLAELIIPAADVSEQISTAGKEASGTGNMKLAMNGALTIGTMDGANVEIREEVGDDNIFIFGLKVDEVIALKEKGYDSFIYYESEPLLQACLNMLQDDTFTPEKPGELISVVRNLLDYGDPYLALADFASYVDAQMALNDAYGDQTSWARKAILNTALNAKFSSDRSIRDYANNIWKLETQK